MTTILPWLTNTEDVIGTADELGKDCKKLDKLYDHCWQIAGHELIHENDNGCIYYARMLRVCWYLILLLVQ